MNRPAPTATERAILAAVRWGHLTIAQAVAKLGTDRARTLHILRS